MGDEETSHRPKRGSIGDKMSMSTRETPTKEGAVGSRAIKRDCVDGGMSMSKRQSVTVEHGERGEEHGRASAGDTLLVKTGDVLPMDEAKGDGKYRRANTGGRLSEPDRDSLDMEPCDGGLKSKRGIGSRNPLKWPREQLRPKRPNPFLESPAHQKSRRYAPMDMGDEMKRLRREKKYFDMYRERDVQKLQELKLYHGAAYRDRQVEPRSEGAARQRERRANVPKSLNLKDNEAPDFSSRALKSRIADQLDQLKRQSSALREMAGNGDSSPSSSRPSEPPKTVQDLSGLKVAFQASKVARNSSESTKNTAIALPAIGASNGGEQTHGFCNRRVLTASNVVSPQDSQVEQRKIFVRTLLEKFGGVDEAYDKLDDLKEDDVSRERIATIIEKYKMPVTTTSIFGWLGDVVDYARLAISRKVFKSKTRVFTWYLGYSEDRRCFLEEDDKAAMFGALELEGPLLGQRVHRPCEYFKLRHPLLKSAKALKERRNKALPPFQNLKPPTRKALRPQTTVMDIVRRDATDDAARAKDPLAPQAAHSTTGIDAPQSPERKTPSARVPGSCSRNTALSSSRGRTPARVRGRSPAPASSTVTSSADLPTRSPTRSLTRSPLSGRSARSPSVTIVEPVGKQPRLRERGGTLIFSKEEQKELRHRMEFCYLRGKKDALTSNVRAPASSAEARRELRSNYIRLLLFPNQKILVNPAIIEPTKVLWRYSDIKDMQAFCAKASTTTAKLNTGPVACVYNTLLQRVKTVEELVDGGYYLLSNGGAIEYPLPLAFQQQKDIMERNITHYHKLSQDLRSFFRLLGATTKPSTPVSNDRSTRQPGSHGDVGTEMCNRVAWERACEKLKGERNRLRAPAEWVFVLTRLGVGGVTADFFRWLTTRDALSTEQLILALQRPETPVSPQLPTPPVQRRHGGTLLGVTLSNFMLQLFPGKAQHASASLSITKNRLKHNDERLRKNMNFLLERKRGAQRGNELLSHEQLALPNL